MPTPNVDVIPSQMKYFRDQIHVGETIARGGSSFVYRGVLLPRNLPIAIKHLFSNGHGVVDRCKREVAMLMGLAHDHVVTVLGYCELSEKEVYVLLELSNEGSLQTRITSVPRVAVEMPQAIRWCLQIVNALQYLCAMNVLHLDLKLANILLFGTNVKLCDFSASKFVDPQRLETQGTRSYTVEYASPEVLNSDNQVFPETDLYGLGCIICELVTGMPPWGDDKEPTIRRKVHEGESPNVMDHPWPLDCPVEVRQLAQQLLSYDPSARSSLAEANAILWAATKPRVPEVPLFTTKCSLPKGWITSLTPLPLSAALSELANVVIPAGRPDLERHKKRATLTSLPALHLKIASLCRDGKLRHNLTPTSDQQSVYDAATGAATGASVITFDEDMHAIALYTAESPVCYLINGTLSHLTCTVQDTLRHTAPLIQCIYGAIRRLGSVFRGCAFRVVYGDTPLMRSAFDHHTSHFRAGQEVNMHQFVSFTKSPSYIQHFTANTTRPMILFKCEDLVGYDINNFSCCVLSNRPSEEEVIVLPPAYFVVKGTSFKVNNMVTVELTYCQAKAAAHTFWEAQQHDARAETPANDADVPAATASEASQPTPLVIAISAGNAQLVRRNGRERHRPRRTWCRTTAHRCAKWSCRRDPCPS